MNIDDARAFGIGWEWQAATAILPPAYDQQAMVYDAIDDAVEDDPEHFNLGISHYPILDRIRFGLPADGSPAPVGSPLLREGPILLAGAGRKEAQAELAHPVPPMDRIATKRPAITYPHVPALPLGLDPSTWTAVAVEEARRVAADPSSISSDVSAAIGTIAAVDEAERQAEWTRLESLVDRGVAAHLRDLWRYSVLGTEYDPENDRYSPHQVMMAVRGVPRPLRPDIRDFTARDLPGAPGLTQAWVVWVREGAVELVGPFFTGRALVAAVRVRTHELRGRTVERSR